MFQKLLAFASKHLGWAKSVLSEKDGTGSTSRIALLILVLTVCGVLIYSVAVHHELPNRDTLLGLSSLAGIGAGGYGVNRISHKDDEKGPAESDAPIVDTGADRGDTK
jgi:hypothetical protein